LRAQKVLAFVVLFLALCMALGHAPLALGISFLFRPQGGQPPRPPPSGQQPARRAFPFFAIGLYFLLATVLYIIGGILVASGMLFKLANLGLIILAIVDNLLLVYTRTMPNIFLGRIIPWSWGWFPVGTVQVLVGQSILIVLCAVLLVRLQQGSKI
jgi:hypothetical protein